ncbi:MAG: cytochrome c3 family protein [Acidobacteriota bacterium]|nr:cytochrome c family protein [Blastocatellia bacterium]MDW8413068.1 cytochrome c3 family protein [Acidobacteriota bacterium]
MTIKKLKVLFIFSVLGFFALPVVATIGQTMPGKMVFDDPENHNSPYAGDYGKVDFDHDQHVKARPASGGGEKESCVTCHHTNSSKLTEALEEEVPKCTACHTDTEGPSPLEGTNESKKFKGLTAIIAEEAFHGKGSNVGCIGCHQTLDQSPKSCKECHKSD